VFEWASVCHARVDTHVLFDWDDSSEVLHTTFDLIVGKEPPFRLQVTPEKGHNEFAVCFLWSIGEDKVHIQGKAEVLIVNVQFLRDRVPEMVKVIPLKLSTGGGILDLPDRCEGTLEVF